MSLALFLVAKILKSGALALKLVLVASDSVIVSQHTSVVR